MMLIWNLDQQLNLTRETKQRLKKKKIFFDVTAIFSIYGQFGEIPKPDSRSIVCKTYVFINSNLLSYKNGKQN